MSEAVINAIAIARSILSTHDPAGASAARRRVVTERLMFPRFPRVTLNSAKLNCPPIGDLIVECDYDAFDNPASARANIRRLEEIWPNAWSSIYEAFESLLAEYQHEEHVQASAKRLIVSGSSFEESDDPEWTLAIHTDPFAGVYEFQMRGTSLTDAGVTF